MVVIPAGDFWMGSPDSEADREDDERRHRVAVSAFAVGQTEVTFAEYDQFCAATGRDKPNDAGWGRGTRPVINVSWNDAVAYAEWLSRETAQPYRLPTEAEWEYACRGGVAGERYCGGNDVGRLAWYVENSGDQTHPVGQKAANGFNLYDMSGNVSEWICSLYEGEYRGAEVKCIEKGTYGLLAMRGGSWGYRPAWVRSALRYRGLPAFRFNFVGFRLARSL